MRQMNTVERFKKFSKKTYNAQDVLKNHILQRFPILYVEDAKNYDLKQLEKFKDKSDYVWVVDKDIEVYRSFPWHYKPKRDDYGCTICFPYVFKESKRVSSWEKVRLVPTIVNDETHLVTETNICGDYDVYRGKHNFDIFFLGDKETGTWEDLRKRFPEAIAVKTYQDAMRVAVTDMFWIVYDDLIVDKTFEFDYEPDEWSFKYPHLFGNGKNDKFDGIVLMPKSYIPTDKELEYRFLAQKKQIKQVASKPRNYEIFSFDTYEDYEVALKTSKTELFWHVPKDVIVEKDFDFSINFDFYNMFDRDITHVFKNKDSYDGIVLFSKRSPVTRKEFEHRFYIEKKEWDVVASHPKPYDIFNVENYNDYLNALDKTTTELFWVSTNNISVDHDYINNFYIDWHNRVDREQTHVFLHKVNNELYKNGLILCSTCKALNEKEVEYRHPVERKEWNVIVSGPVKYPVYNIDSYNDYLTALNSNGPEMFWMSSSNISPTIPDLYFLHENEYDRKTHHSFIHQVEGKTYRNGLFLISKHKTVTEKEIEHRFIVNAKEWDTVVSTNGQYEKFTVNNYNDYLNALEKSKTELFWGVPSDVIVLSDFKFDMNFNHSNEYDRKINHVMFNGDYRDGIVLFSKHAVATQKEVDTRFYVNKKDHNIVASYPKPYDFFFIDTYDQYLDALEKSATDMFWMGTHNIKISDTFNLNMYFSHHETFDRNINHVFKHKCGDEISFDGLFLCTKKIVLTEKEVEHRLIAKRKEWDIVASGPVVYDKFIIKNYADYLNAVQNSKTEMFWSIPDDVDIANNFKFDLYFPHNQWFERSIHHIFKNGSAYDGVALMSKKLPAIEHEVTHRFYLEKKEYDIVASNPKTYDIVFISKDEEHADTNYSKLKERFPNAKRVHGVQGIHQAHIEAARLCSSEMIWVVDADAEIIDNFNFDYYIPTYDPDSKKTVHVWKSLNPINNLVYGYGAVKLLPKELTLTMDTTKPDMTTSISTLFKSINRVSNITKFNTDPFSTWRSAFRECVKLSSKTIDGQRDEETDFRLNVWCTRGKDKEFGDYCIAGANAGKQYGIDNIGNIEALRKINDFDWLKEQFTKLNQQS